MNAICANTVNERNVLAFPSQQHVNLEAIQQRRNLARELARDFLRTSPQNRISYAKQLSVLVEHISHLPCDDPELIVGFTALVTEKLIDRICENEKNTEMLLFLCARVLELSAYSLIDPRDPDKIIEYLGASKQHGYFFTPPKIAVLMAEKLLKLSNDGFTILDPSAGSGSLLGTIMLIGAKKGIRPSILSAIEKDSFTTFVLKKVLFAIKKRCNLRCKLNVICGDALEVLSTNSVPPLAKHHYDQIVMNPPYGRIRFLKSSLTNKETAVATERLCIDSLNNEWKHKTRILATQIKDITTQLGIGKGMQEYPRTFLALSIAKLKGEGSLAIIFPDSWLSSKAAEELRTRLVRERWIHEVLLFDETSKLFATVNQPTSVLIIKKQSDASHFILHTADSNPSTEGQCVSYRLIEENDPDGLKIPKATLEQMDIYKHLHSFSHIGDVRSILNRRGELDQTFGKSLMTNQSTSMRLIRGDHIERYVLRPPSFSEQPSYIKKNNFVAQFGKSSKYLDVNSYRIVGRQCSYMRKGRRLSFALIEPGYVVGNSCNYLRYTDVPEGSKPDDRMWALLGILNSLVIEWYFRIFNSNNHVANYEIDLFPVLSDSTPMTAELASSTRVLWETSKTMEFHGKYATTLEDYHDALVAKSFDLSIESMDVIVRSIEPERLPRICNMMKCMENGLKPDSSGSRGWFNHSLPRLSQLDLEMIKHVPQGGNWQDIPENIPSKRLDQIRQMTKERGVVRTTYYGRLRPDQPAYTIATYYNRPGNGTNIHPYENRTLTAREAARLQSFPDDYIFIGAESFIRKQIGNAVPPLLSYAVGKKIRSELGRNGSCADMFCGAGGLSLGLEMAGWNVVVAVDNDPKVSSTYKFNRPCKESYDDKAQEGTTFLGVDLFDKFGYKLVKTAINAQLCGQPLDLLAGGPPCQGFSHAGWRRPDDMRNNLASLFIHLADELRPKFFLLENVEGLLTFNGGQVVKDIILALEEIGYKVPLKPWLLNAEEFGVPQMRRRVFILASLDRTRDLSPPEPIFGKCYGRRRKPLTGDLFQEMAEPVNVAEAFLGISPLGSEIFKQQPLSKSSYGFAEWAKGQRDIASMLAVMAAR